MDGKNSILLLDDEPDLREMIMYQLKAKGYEVETGENGLEGLEKLKTFTPDLIILDMNMPKMGGIEFYQSVCDENDKPKYPILVLTARANMEQLFSQFNVDGFMSKPFEINELLEKVGSIINSKKSEDETKKTMQSKSQLKLCLVDDNKEVLDQIDSAFNDAGYSVTTLNSGEEAIAQMTDISPHLVIIRLGLSDISGDDVLTKVRNTPETKNVSFVLYSASTDAKLDDQVKLMIQEKSGVVNFLESNNPNELVKIIDKEFEENYS